MTVTKRKERSRSTETSGSRARSSSIRSTEQRPRPHHNKAGGQRTIKASSRTAAATKTKPALSKKPKHLKRKLEQTASSNEESPAAAAAAAAAESRGDHGPGNHRDELLQKMKQWQEEKAAYLEKKQSRKKRRKTSSATPNVQDPAGTSFESERTQSNVEFPRRNGGKKGEPASDRQTSSLHSSRSRRDHDLPRSRKVGKAQSEATSTVAPPQKVDGGAASRERPRVVPAVAAPAPVDDDGNNGDSGDDQEDDDNPPLMLLVQKRERGKRRRGRKNNESSTTATTSAAGTIGVNDQEPVVVDDPPTLERLGQGEKDGTIKPTSSPETDKSSTRKDTRRYCVGRKPVTDYVVGQSYPGTVVYVKPFGVFLDVGCHSDAFCHVSRLSDEFVEDPTAGFKPGDSVTAARVVEVDRKGKRITVSLQSEARAADERQSVDARQDRLRKRHKKSPALEDTARGHEQVAVEGDRRKPAQPSVVSKDDQPSPKATSIVASQPALPADIQSDSGLTPQQQLKRARKLERRAARRADKDNPAAPTQQ
jgi:predicted RNA-binding protein with RPS1 domain